MEKKDWADKLFIAGGVAALWVTVAAFSGFAMMVWGEVWKVFSGGCY